MLRTNSKQARENIRQYIIENFTPENYTDEEITGFENIAKFILDVFKSEYYDNYCNRNVARRYTQAEAFKDWCSGLPSVLDTCYYYNRSAVEDVKNILEETDAEASKYNEQQAEELLTSLIYRELTRACMR